MHLPQNGTTGFDPQPYWLQRELFFRRGRPFYCNGWIPLVLTHMWARHAFSFRFFPSWNPWEARTGQPPSSAWTFVGCQAMEDAKRPGTDKPLDTARNKARHCVFFFGVWGCNSETVWLMSRFWEADLSVSEWLDYVCC